MKKHALLFALFVGCIVLSGAAIIGYQDIAVITTPGNPASGYDRLYVTSGGGLGCLTSGGANCIPTGAGSPLTTKGDMYTFGTANTRLAVGTNGQVLYSNSGATNGVDWEAPISLTTTGTSGAATYTPGNPNVLNIPNYAGGGGGLTPVGTPTCSGSAVCTTATGSAVVTTAGTTVTFASIPGTYSNLHLMVCGRTTRASTQDAVLIGLNGDLTAADYNSIFQNTSGGTVSSGLSNGSLSAVDNIAGNSSTSSRQGCFVAEIGAYAGTIFQKIIYTTGSFDAGVSGLQIELGGANWISTAAVTSIVLTPGVGPNFIAGSSFYLYGY